MSIESTQPSNGLVAHPENEAERALANNVHSGPPEQQYEDEDEGDDEVDLGEESDDVSILHSHFYILSNSGMVRMLKLLWNLSRVHSISGAFHNNC